MGAILGKFGRAPTTLKMVKRRAGRAGTVSFRRAAVFEARIVGRPRCIPVPGARTTTGRENRQGCAFAAGFCLGRRPWARLDGPMPRDRGNRDHYDRPSWSE